MEDLLWLWLDGNYFCLPSDLHIYCVYIPHENSKIYTEREINMFQTLAQETAHSQTKGMILHLGDFNSRIGNLNENWDPADITRLNHQEPYIEANIHASIPIRSSNDNKINNFGRKLINMCETLGLVILNGRTPGDNSGKLTCYTHNGSSLIDYGICSLELFKYIKYFQVQEQTWYSDHSPIQLSFKPKKVVDWANPNKRHNNINKCCLLLTYKWSNGNEEEFLKHMNSPNTTREIHDVQKSLNNSTLTPYVRKLLKSLHG